MIWVPQSWGGYFVDPYEIARSRERGEQWAREAIAALTKKLRQLDRRAEALRARRKGKR